MKWQKRSESGDISHLSLAYEGALEVRECSPPQRSTWAEGLQSQSPEDQQEHRTGEKTDMGKKWKPRRQIQSGQRAKARPSAILENRTGARGTKVSWQACTGLQWQPRMMHLPGAQHHPDRMRNRFKTRFLNKSLRMEGLSQQFLLVQDLELA